MGPSISTHCASEERTRGRRVLLRAQTAVVVALAALAGMACGAGRATRPSVTASTAEPEPPVTEVASAGWRLERLPLLEEPRWVGPGQYLLGGVRAKAETNSAKWVV